MPAFPPPRCDKRAGGGSGVGVGGGGGDDNKQRGFDQLIEPLDPNHLKSETEAQEVSCKSDWC